MIVHQDTVMGGTGIELPANLDSHFSIPKSTNIMGQEFSIQHVWHLTSELMAES
jgi:hypothetical protein